MFCEKCGRKLPDNSTFCPYCGMKTRLVSRAPAQKKKSRVLPVILISAGAILILAVAVGLFLLKDRFFPEGGKPDPEVAEDSREEREEDSKSGKSKSRETLSGKEDSETEEQDTASGGENDPASEEDPEESLPPETDSTEEAEPAESTSETQDEYIPSESEQSSDPADSSEAEPVETKPVDPVIAKELANDPNTEYMYLDMDDDGSGWFTVYYLVRNTSTGTFDCKNIRGKTVATPAYENAKDLVDHAFRDPEGVYLPLQGRRAAILWLSPYGLCAYTHTREEYLNGNSANLKYMLNEAEIERTFQEWGLDTDVTPIPKSFREN